MTPEDIWRNKSALIIIYLSFNYNFLWISVFEILLHFVQYSDWEKAFYSIIPKRKGVRSLQESEEKPNGDCQVSEPLSENIPDDMKLVKDNVLNHLKNNPRPNPLEALNSDGLSLLQQDKGVVKRDGS